MTNMHSDLRLLEYAPRFDTSAAASMAEKLYGIRSSAMPLPSERDQNFLLTSDSGDRFVLKIANSLEDRALLEAQNQMVTHLGTRVSFCPRLIQTISGQEIAETKSPGGEMNFVRLVTYLPGVMLAKAKPHSRELLFDLGRKLGQLDRELADFDNPAVHRDFHWDLANGLRVIDEYGTLIQDLNLRKLVWQYARGFERNVGPLLPRLRLSVIHNDANDYNVLVGNDNVAGQATVVGLIDFGDVVYSYTAGDLAVAIAYMVLDKPSPIAAAVQLVAGYTAENPLSDDEIQALYGLALMRLCMSACLAAYQQQQQPDNKYLEISQRAITESLPRLAAIDSRLAVAAFRSAGGPSLTSNKAQTLALRQKLLGRNLKLAYREPVKIVRGWMQYLYDEEGRQFTDAYNNVAHVGHCHPKIVRAGQDQMARLNTNTRYLHDLINSFAERLISMLPAPLSVCFFVNSGSEANELALRLARAYTRARDLIVLEDAYHGNTTTLIDISPYKHDGPGGCGAPSWVHTVPLPDVYRGLYRSENPDAVEKYLQHVTGVIAKLLERSVGLAGFISESLPSVAGQIVLPGGYLSKVYAAVREAGGVCIADEVQTGYGRVGTHFWGFETYGVVPDIVVLGKPIGNGHPIGAVVTTPEIAAAFDNGMEFFSTFGGNTVSCAIGLAVLDLVLEENMQSHALRVGERMIQGLRGLMDRHEIIGDVRGSGFFLGVELVRSRHELERATAEADRVVNRLRAQGILIGTDGPFHNVLKIRPPLPFSDDNAEQLIAALDRILAEASNST
jgi:4-aminobutyrate aminotransferase-like enzyme/Ser/Thr protein kinase RdoA (MazF antagonist)